MRKHIREFAAGLFIALLLLTSLQAAPQKPSSKSKPSLKELRSIYTAHMKFLACDDMKGRKAASPEGRKVAEYISDRFEQLGLKPIGDDETYFQAFQITSKAILRDCLCTLEVTLKKDHYRAALAPSREFQPFGFSGIGEVEAPVVFVGYGISAPEKNYDDYKDVDVKGKIVVMLRYAPAEGSSKGPFNPVKRNSHAYFSNKLTQAQKHGAVGAILFTGKHYHARTADNLSAMWTKGGGRTGKIPFGQATHKQMKKFFKAAEINIDAIQKKIDKTVKPQSFEVKGATVRIKIESSEKTYKMQNVVGLLPGCDPVLSKEVIIVGGHFDHIGVRRKRVSDTEKTDRIYNGADDNASGTAGVMAVAEMLARSENPLKRSVLFVALDGEEIGLLGSEHFLNYPLVEKNRIVTMLNLDMIGRSPSRSVMVAGVGTATMLEDIVKKANKPLGLKLHPVASGMQSSDHMVFASRGIPVLFFNTGLHKDLHGVDDEIRKIKTRTAVDVARLVAGTVRGISDQQQAPQFVSATGATRNGPRKAYLGITAEDIREGVKIGRVMPGSPAAKASLKSGDVIVAVDGQKVADVSALLNQLSGKKPKDKVKIKYQRNDRQTSVDVELGAK